MTARTYCQLSIVTVYTGVVALASLAGGTWVAAMVVSSFGARVVVLACVWLALCAVGVWPGVRMWRAVGLEWDRTNDSA